MQIALRNTISIWLFWLGVAGVIQQVYDQFTIAAVIFACAILYTVVLQPIVHFLISLRVTYQDSGFQTNPAKTHNTWGIIDQRQDPRRAKLIVWNNEGKPSPENPVRINPTQHVCGLIADSYV